MLVVAGQNAAEVWIQRVHEKWIKTLRFPPYYPMTTDLEKCDHVTSFFHSTFIPNNHRAHVFVSKEEVLSLHNLVWKAASVKRMFYSQISKGADAMKEVWRHEEKTPYGDSDDVCFMQNTAEWMAAGYAISESFADPMRLPTKFLEKARHPVNDERMPLHTSRAWERSKLAREKALKVGVDRTHWCPIFNSTISDWDRTEREERIAQYSSSKTLLAYNMQMPEI